MFVKDVGDVGLIHVNKHNILTCNANATTKY
jgi:hypothetical protein